MEGYDREFWQFSDQLRLQTSALSLGDSIWSPADRRNAGPFGASPNDAAFSAKNVNFNEPSGGPGLIGSGKLAFGESKHDRFNNSNLPAAGGYAKSNNNYYYSSFALNKMGSYGCNNSTNASNGGEVKSYFNKSAGRPANNNSSSHNKKGEYGKKKQQSKNSDNNGTAADKRFKTLPASEALPRGEPVGGYIFVCNNDTMDENLRRELFGKEFNFKTRICSQFWILPTLY
jgi:hypothetical protein